MSWNFFDAWKSKRTNEKPVKCTAEELESQTRKCKKKYDVWQECVEISGFNDPMCRETRLAKYYKCTMLQNRMKIYLEDEDIHNKS